MLCLPTLFQSHYALLSLLLAGYLLCASTQHAQALTLGQAAMIAQNARPAAFQTVEFTTENKEDRTPQWQKVKARLGQDMAILQKCLDSIKACTGTAQIAWRKMVLELRNESRSAQAQMVNAFFNQWAYRSDEEAYGRSDYWATPIAFMENSGDCEDYAIAKYTTLLFLGVPDRAMRITAVIDNNRGGIGHAILSVSDAGQNMILDNLVDGAYADSQQNGYTPRFAVNQSGVYTYAEQPQIIWASIER
jgi:predicted transglutaminase-like cysteine proteinase